jgi:L-2-hydroxyglutarate oxidase LhgO
MDFTECDILIIGCGIMGMTLAYELNKQYPNTKIIIIDKEIQEGLHASGRNSGVLHTGFYYYKDSLKAKFSRDGGIFMREFCEQQKLKINPTGKLVVARNEDDIDGLNELAIRGESNNCGTYILTSEEVKKIEPYAKTHKYALYSPHTVTVDPREVCGSLKRYLENQGVLFHFSTSYIKRININTILTDKRTYKAEMFINAAGLYADYIAKDFDAGHEYKIVPFKGIYLTSNANDLPLKTNIYPVPNLKNTFLGVHLTVDAFNKVKIGPTAIPALWRENYNFKENFQLDEFCDILLTQIKLFTTNTFNFRSLAFKELLKFSKAHLSKEVNYMVDGLDLSKIKTWGKPGIRAQLIHKKTLDLVQDFVIEKKENSIHILNAISPAFTSSFSFAKWIVEEVGALSGATSKINI